MDNVEALEARLLSGRAAARAIGIGAATLYRMAGRGQVPFYRIGETGVRFKLGELVAALRRPARGEVTYER